MEMVSMETLASIWLKNLFFACTHTQTHAHTHTLSVSLLGH